MPPRKETKNKARSEPSRRRGGASSRDTRPASPGAADATDGLLGAVAALFGALLYVPALGYGWVWNDALLVSSKGGGGESLEGWLPFAHLLTRAEWIVGVGQPGLFHATSLLLHAVSVWLLFRLARALGASSWLAFGAALLFAAHPVHAEAVAYVSGRPDLLATVLALAALALARSAPVRGAGGWRTWRAVLAYGCVALAALSGEVALATPLLLVALDRWGAPRLAWRERRPLVAGFFAVTVAALLLRFLDRGYHPAAGHEGVPAAAAWVAPWHALYDSLRVLVVPTGLNAIRSLRSAEAASVGPVAGALLLVAAIAAVVAWRRRDPLARVGAAVLGCTLLFALPLPLLQGAYVEERALFFPSAGLVLLAASAVSGLARFLPAPRRAAPAVLTGVAAIFAVLTLARIPVWRDNVSLLQAAVAAAPDDPDPLVKLARNHYALGEVGAALTAAKRAIAVDSTDVDAHRLLTVLLRVRGDMAGAEREARRAIALDSKDAISWANLGDALTQEGRLPEALAACRRAVALDSTSADNWYNLGVSLGSTGDLPGATEAYRQTIAIAPGHVQAWNNLGAVLAAQGRLTEARDAYQRAVALAPGSVETRMNLALAYLRLGDRESAAKERTQILRLDPSVGSRLDELFRAMGAGAPAR
ncbi:MAG: tetratricopeptide repeat protein [Hyphomicrobiales bacterium]